MFKRNIFKTSYKACNLSVNIQRRFACNDITILTVRYTFSWNTIRASSCLQHLYFIIFIRIRIGMPAHLFVVLSNKHAFAWKIIIVKKRFVHSKETAIRVFPKESGLCAVYDFFEKNFTLFFLKFIIYAKFFTVGNINILDKKKLFTFISMFYLSIA